MSMTTPNVPLPKSEAKAEARAPRQTVSPRVDVYENATELLVLADVPGATKESVDVKVANGKLTLTARREIPQGGTVLAAEYRPVDYARAFVIPKGVDPSRIEATLTAGVLTLRLPKAESLKPRRIEIKSA